MENLQEKLERAAKETDETLERCFDMSVEAAENLAQVIVDAGKDATELEAADIIQDKDIEKTSRVLFAKSYIREHDNMSSGFKAIIFDLIAENK